MARGQVVGRNPLDHSRISPWSTRGRHWQDDGQVMLKNYLFSIASIDYVHHLRYPFDSLAPKTTLTAPLWWVCLELPTEPMLPAITRRRILSARDRLFSLTVTRMASSSTPSPAGPVEMAIREKLTTALQPSELGITNDSWQHRHHSAMRAQGGGNGETHFSIQVVSELFRGKNTMQRHRMIYSALSNELAEGLHALSLKTKTPEEAEKETVAS